ncbi:MAG: cyclodeaminase/cyclohydrolase family protein [Mycobacteriales bacterium]
MREWLDRLASSAPAPGGGAAAAVQAAVGAALLEMVCNLTIGKPRYAAVEEAMTVARAEASAARAEALELADADAEAFGAVSEAYRLPREQEDRPARIQQALVGAAEVPLRTAELATRLIALAGSIRADANQTVVSDVAVAAVSARAALESAVINVEVNLALITDAGVRDRLAGQLAPYPVALGEADAIVAAVRAGM